MRFAAFDIRRDPSKEWALVFSALAIAGVSISLFVRRRRVWVRVGTPPTAADPNAGPPGDGLIVEVAGLARRDDPALAGEVAEISAAIVGNDHREQDESDDGLGSR